MFETSQVVKYRIFFSLFPHATIWRPLFAFLLTDFSSIPRSSSFPSVGRVKRKASLALWMGTNEAPLVATLIEHRFTFGRYFINPKRLAARKNLALLCDSKVGCAFVLFLATSRATKPECCYRSPAAIHTHFLLYNFQIFARFNMLIDCHHRERLQNSLQIFYCFLKKRKKTRKT